MATAKKKKKYDWVKLKAEYQTTNISLRELAEKHKIPWGTVNSRSNKEKWAKDKVEIQSKIKAEVEQKTISAVIDEKVEANKRHIELYEEGLDVVAELLAVYKATAQERKKRGNVNPFNLEKIFSCIEKAQKGQRLALNLDNQDESEDEPEMVFVENVDLDKI